MLDNSDAALSLESAFRSSRWFDVQAGNSVAPFKIDLVAGRVRGIVVIPQDFGRLSAASGPRQH